MDIHELARQNQQSAWKVLEDTCIIEAWERIGATVRLVGSLRTGLLAKSRAEYLFNRNYSGSESAKMDEAFNYLYVIPKSW